ncbi:MAG: hypothetical protein QOI76_802 [Frankiales bacterium]|nr:hypothetical protein [Frankiales bacterium]
MAIDPLREAAAAGLQPLALAARRIASSGIDLQVAVLVEGSSDQAAVEAAAGRRGRNLFAEGVAVVAIGGATNARHFLDVFGPYGMGVRVAGLCDEPEVGEFARGLGLGARPTRESLETLGFFVCVADLEDELIRALGTEAVERVVAAQGELRAFRTLQHQAAQQGRRTDQQLRRFMGSRGGRKIRYGRLLVEALDPAALPGPLDRLLAAV